MAVVTHLVDLLHEEEWLAEEEELTPPCAACDNTAHWIMRHSCCDFFQLICEKHHQKYTAFFQNLAALGKGMECLECGTIHTKLDHCVSWEKL